MERKPQRPDLFDNRHLAPRRDRAQAHGFGGSADVLHRAVAGSLAERLAAVTRGFEDRALIGTGGGVLAGVLADALPPGPLTQLELSPARAAAAGVSPIETLDPLPLEPASQDLILSSLELHWANDPVGQLIQMRRALRPDGLMIAALFGGQTLVELRAILAEAEVEISGGLSPRIAPMAELRDMGALLQRAGFALPVADTERFDLSYPDLWALMRDLRAMGETNILAGRRRGFTPRRLFEHAARRYAEAFPADNGRIAATFEVIYLTGWAPADSQPKPLRPGSATARLADALGTTEHSAGEQSGPGRPAPKIR